MAGCAQLDASRRTPSRRVIYKFLLLLCLVALPAVAVAQDLRSDADRLAASKAAFDRGEWEEAARLAHGTAEQSPDLDLLAGLAYARLKRWDDAKAAFAAGHRKSVTDARFLIELAGVAYEQHGLSTAKRELHAALRLAPHDAYAREFLGTIYFLEGNIDAALKYWNAVDKPRLRAIDFDPTPQLRAALLQRALTFNAPQILTGEALANTKARLDNLGVFPHYRIELQPSPSGEYDASLHLAERNGWGDSKLEGIVSLLSGVPYDTVYPEFFNLDRDAVNFTSLARWDSQKRRYSGELSAPAFGDPSLRVRAFFDARNENWNLSQTFSTTGAPLTNLNLRRITGGAEFRSVVNGNWNWTAALEVVHRDFRNLAGHTAKAEQPFFASSDSLAVSLAAERTLLRLPEERFDLVASLQTRGGRGFRDVLGPFGTVRSSLRAHWFPRASGDDYEMSAQVRAGATAGKVSLDELFELGLERDNDLWLRGQAGTTDGRKGAAPLGRRYFLANWEMDKNVYRGGFFNIKVGPFLDNGAVADSSGLFGSRGWAWSAGAQCKIRVLANVTAVLIYGRDLRAGRNVFYGTSLR